MKANILFCQFFNEDRNYIILANILDMGIVVFASRLQAHLRKKKHTQKPETLKGKSLLAFCLPQHNPMKWAKPRLTQKKS